ncbi:MAG: PLDc N-terminal domain-containing protein, partial [Stenotrophomonas koreensis]
MLTTLMNGWDWFTGLPHLASIGLALYVVYLSLLTGYIVLQKREPVATLSWILSLAALPYAGLLIYYLLGPQKVQR